MKNSLLPFLLSVTGRVEMAFARDLELDANKKAELRGKTITMISLGNPAFLGSGPATFCPCLTVGLALVILRKLDHLTANVSTE